MFWMGDDLILPDDAGPREGVPDLDVAGQKYPGGDGAGSAKRQAIVWTELGEESQWDGWCVSLERAPRSAFVDLPSFFVQTRCFAALQSNVSRPAELRDGDAGQDPTPSRSDVEERNAAGLERRADYRTWLWKPLVARPAETDEYAGGEAADAPGDFDDASEELDLEDVVPGGDADEDAEAYGGLSVRELQKLQAKLLALQRGFARGWLVERRHGRYDEDTTTSTYSYGFETDDEFVALQVWKMIIH